MNPETNNDVPPKKVHRVFLGHRNNKQCIISVTDDVSKVAGGKKKKGSYSCRIFNRVVISVLFISLVICVSVYAVGSVIQENMEAKMIAYKQELQKEAEVAREDLRYDSVGGLSSVAKRNTNNSNRRGSGRRGRRGRRRSRQNRRNASPCVCPRSHRQQPIEKPAAHLIITTGMVTYSEHDNDIDCKIFVWTEMRDRVIAGLTLIRHPTRQDPYDVIGVQIDTPGTYDLYSQVVVSGPSTMHPYYRAQDIVRIRNNEKQVLLTSFATQQMFHINGVENVPVDTVFQYGVFYLRQNDVIRVEATDSVQYQNAANREAFYFGVAKR